MFSLSSLNAGDCEQDGLARVTMVVEGDDGDLRQCVRQLNKLIDVIEVEDLNSKDSVQRELAFIQVQADVESRRSILEVAQVMHCDVVHLEPDSITLQVTAEPSRIDQVVALLQPLGITQIVRSGLVAIRVKN
jgi:acetolactate synthase-1/3 small subunit